MRRFTEILLLSGCAVIALLSSCRNDQPSNPASAEPLQPSPTSPQYSDVGLFEAHLKCSQIQDMLTSASEGSSWNSLTIGISTEEVVTERLESEGTLVDASESYLQFVMLPPRTDSPWLGVQACFRDGILVVMQIDGASDLYLTVEDWVNKYGRPDRVTWSNSYISRTVIWAEEGIIALVDYQASASLSVVLFPPISRSDLAGNWLTAALPQRLTGEPGDTYPVPPPIEDPWGIKQLPTE